MRTYRPTMAVPIHNDNIGSLFRTQTCPSKGHRPCPPRICPPVTPWSRLPSGGERRSRGLRREQNPEGGTRALTAPQLHPATVRDHDRRDDGQAEAGAAAGALAAGV